MFSSFELQSEWLDQEHSSGAPSPKQAVLSTIGLNGEAHGGVVAIRVFFEKLFIFYSKRT